VLDHRGQSHFQRGSELAHRRGTAAQSVDHAAPPRVRERVKRAVQTRLVKHMLNYSRRRRPVKRSVARTLVCGLTWPQLSSEAGPQGCAVQLSAYQLLPGRSPLPDLARRVS
jgi:hypothetical protein